KRGYGFIGRDQGGRDAYVATYTLARCDIRKLSKGQRVIVKVVERGRGPKTVWLRLIGLDQEQPEVLMSRDIGFALRQWPDNAQPGYRSRFGAGFAHNRNPGQDDRGFCPYSISRCREMHHLRQEIS